MAENKKILIKKASIVNSDGIKESDILICGGRISRIARSIKAEDAKVIEASAKFVFPAFIDIHTHLRSPGREDEEDLMSGSLAAAKGGFVKIFSMPNTEPPLDSEGLVSWIIEESRRINIVDIYPIGAITKGRRGRELTEFGSLKKAGCLSLSDDGDSVKDSLVMRRALEYAKMFDLLLISHCEDKSLSAGGSMRESSLASKHGMSPVPDIAESLIVARDIELARYLKARIHIAHVSTAKSVEIIRKAKKEGLRVSAETCPHYFSLTFEDIAQNNFSSYFKVNPPLGDSNDLKAVIKGLKEGIIDCIATDHAPHSEAEKELPFEEAPFGMIGLELAFAITYTYLIRKEGLPLTEIAAKFSENPSRLYGFQDNGRVEEGRDASLVIADLNKKWKVCEEDLSSKSKNTPFLNQELEGVIEYTIRCGKVIYDKLSPVTHSR